MDTISIAELKHELSALLRRVRAGEELVIRDRNLPIAKIVPLKGEDMDSEELALVASGQMRVPKRELDHKRFWAVGEGIRTRPNLTKTIRRVVSAERQDCAGVLGHKRDHSHLRAQTKRQRS